MDKKNVVEGIENEQTRMSLLILYRIANGHVTHGRLLRLHPESHTIVLPYYVVRIHYVYMLFDTNTVEYSSSSSMGFGFR